MIRSKSSISLRNLANSLKESINRDHNKIHKKQFIPLRNSASTINLGTYNQNTKSGYDNFNSDQYLLMMETRKSRFTSVDAKPHTRGSHLSLQNYTIRPTNYQQLLKNRKQKTLSLAKHQPIVTPTFAQSSATLPFRVIAGQSHNCPSSTISVNAEQNHIMNILYEQHKILKSKLQQNTTKYSLKNYHKRINEVEKLIQQLQQIQKKQKTFIEYKNQFQNRLCFLNEEQASNEMSFNQNLAQKQYCEQLIDKYRSEYQFKEQAKCVMEMLELQRQTVMMNKVKTELSKELQRAQKEYKEWRVEQNLQLKQKRFSNKLKEARIELMKIEQDLDDITEELIAKNKNLSQERQCEPNQIKSNTFSTSTLVIRKVREYICSFFKRYNQLNINHISHGQIADGIDIFLCKQGLIKQFTVFINDNTQLICLTNGIFSLKLTQYCDCLKKIENLFDNQKNQINRVLSGKFQQKIISLKENLQQLIIKKEKYVNKISDLKESIQKALAQDSLSMIELLNNKNCELQGMSMLITSKADGFFNINEIKAKIKELKNSQLKRIQKVKQVYFRLKNIQQIQKIYLESQMTSKHIYTKQREQLQSDINLWSSKIMQIQQIRKGFELKKQKLQKLIEEGIAKMKEKDELQTKIRAIETEIQSLKKQKIQSITQKYQEKKLTKTNYWDKGNQEPKVLTQTTKLNRQVGTYNRLLYDNKNSNVGNQQTRENKDIAVVIKENLSDEYLLSKFKLASLHEEDEDQQESKQTQEAQSLSELGCTKKYEIIPSLNFTKNQEQRHTESSPVPLKETSPYDNGNNVLVSKCNMVQSRTMPSRSLLTLKGLSSTYQLSGQNNFKGNAQNKQNQFQNQHYIFNQQCPIGSARQLQSKRNKQYSSKKNSAIKSSKSTAAKCFKKTNLQMVYNKKLNIQENKKRKTTLILSKNIEASNKSSNRASSVKQYSIQSSKVQEGNTKSKNKEVKKQKSQKDLNSLISNKLLRR